MRTKEYTREDKELQEEKLKNLLLKLWLKNELGVAENSLMLFRLVKWTEKLNEVIKYRKKEEARIKKMEKGIVKMLNKVRNSK